MINIVQTNARPISSLRRTVNACVTELKTPIDAVFGHDLTEITEFVSRHDGQSDVMDRAFEERIVPRDTQQCAPRHGETRTEYISQEIIANSIGFAIGQRSSSEILSYQGAKFSEPFVEIPDLSCHASIRAEMTYRKHP